MTDLKLKQLKASVLDKEFIDMMNDYNRQQAIKYGDFEYNSKGITQVTCILEIIAI